MADINPFPKSPATDGLSGVDDRWPLPVNVSLVPANAQTKALMTMIRCRETGLEDFRYFSDRIVRLLTEHALSFLPVEEHRVTTPTGAVYEGSRFVGSICGISIMRAGECMEPALRHCCPGVRLGTFLIQRDEASRDKTPDSAVFNFSVLPPDIAERFVLVLDPMLATGGTVARAISMLHDDHGVPYENIISVHVIASRMGLHRMARHFPKLHRIVCFEVDDALDDNMYIIPGLGDFGDRYFGTTHKE